MVCSVCGKRNAATATICTRCRATLTTTSSSRQAGGGKSQRAASQSLQSNQPAMADAESRRRRLLSVSLALALSLVLVGVGAVQAATILQRVLYTSGGAASSVGAPAVSAPGLSAGEIGVQICAALKAQDYDKLAQRFDPAPVPPAITDTFNAAALRTELRAADKIQGKVQQCAPGLLSAAPNSGGRMPMTLKRADLPANVTIMVQLHRQSDGSWKIARDTKFAVGI